MDPPRPYGSKRELPSRRPTRWRGNRRPLVLQRGGHVMVEGNETSDVWGRTTNIDEGALSVMAERLESRAKHPFFRRVIAEYLGDLELERISSALEIGCGTGVVSRALAVAPGFRGTITATDVSPHLIDAGRRYAEMEGVEGRIAFEVINAADLHAENSTYDLIIELAG